MLAQDGAADVLPRPLVIAIDGPSGSGKSSVSRELARRLGLEYIDTGAMYRAVCWSCLDHQIDLTDRDAVAERARSVRIVLGRDPEAPGTWADGQDVSTEIRQTSISAAVSAVATNPEVRRVLREQQRALIEAAVAGDRRGCVIEGRDITTVVAPDADVRLLLTASERDRLARRALEVHGSADAQALAATRDQVLRRDADDSTVSNFHAAADGVLAFDSSGRTFDETVQAVLDVIALHLLAEGESIHALDVRREELADDACRAPR